MLLVIMALVLTSACGRGATLGAEEAVEILVLDGVERHQAECVVADLDGELDLAEITGLDESIDEADLARLSSASTACAPSSPEPGGLAAGIGGLEGSPLPGGFDPSLDDLPESELEMELEAELDDVVAELVRGGVTPETAACVGAAIASSPDPWTTLDDDRSLAAMLFACEPRLSGLGR